MSFNCQKIHKNNHVHLSHSLFSLSLRRNNLLVLLFSLPFSVHSKIGGKKCSYNAILVTAHSFMNIVFAFANHRRFVVGRFFFDASTISTQWVLSLTLYFRNDAHFFPLLQWRFFRPSLFNKLQFSSCSFTFSQFGASPSRLHLNGN